MANIFNSVQMPKLTSNRFDLTHDFKFSCAMGRLVPVCCMEAVPGDKFNIDTEFFVRFAPMTSPVMHRIHATTHTFFVPYRILWENFPNWIAKKPDPITDEQHIHPYVYENETTTAIGSLGDYLGIPPVSAVTVEPIAISPMAYAAYQCIYNEYYRDQNLIPEIDYKLHDGDNSDIAASLRPIRKRAWEHDYFTSCLPWAQKGEPVSIPGGDVALKSPITPSGVPGHQYPSWRKSDGAVVIGNIESTLSSDTPPEGFINSEDLLATPLAYDPAGTLETSATAVNTWRIAIRLQEWMEKMARGGSRYIELIKAHFDVNSSDKRLQRPEYITGSKTPVIISEVANTAGESGGLPQGNLAGHGIAVNPGKGGSYYCEEHGIILTIMCIQPTTAYAQGIPKMFTKFDVEEHYWPTFANLGEQEVKNQEIYANQLEVERNKVFGYLPRYAEYRFINNRIAGQFRTTLDFWHMTRLFATPPALNQTFVEVNATKRIFAVEDEGTDELYVTVLNKVSAIRKMPMYATPTF